MLHSTTNDRHGFDPSAQLLNEFKAARGDVPYGSLEELNEALAAFVATKNSQGLEELMGLSPTNMHALQHDFFRTVHVAERVSAVPPILPFIVLERIDLMMLFQGMVLGDQEELLDMAYLLLRTSGIVQRKKKRFSIHPRFSEQVGARDYGSLHPHLFQTLSTAGNWGLSTPVVPRVPMYPSPRLSDSSTTPSRPGPLPVVAFCVSVVVNYWGMLGLVEEIGTEDDAVLRPHPVLQELLSFPDGWAG